ncbi:hypothetical protein ACS0TY_025501 [Phlomoides rotata]
MGIPEVELNSGYKMPLLGLGTASFTTALADEVKAMVHAIERGYRHFDTAAHYGSEEAVGKAIAEALKLGLIKSRSEVFVCSKLWASDNHADRVLLALNKSLQNLNLEYIDLYLIHWPVTVTQESAFEYPVANKKNIIPFDCKAVWSVMEEAQRSGLVKSIGVTGQFWGTDRVVGIQALKDIAKAKAKSVPQVILRWAHQQGVATVVKSYNPQRMQENSDIFDWELSEEECKKISEIPQSRGGKAEGFVSEEGAIKSVEDLWDGEL